MRKLRAKRPVALAPLALTLAIGLISLSNYSPNELIPSGTAAAVPADREATGEGRAFDGDPFDRGSSVGREEQGRPDRAYGQLPLSFEQNAGQFEKGVSFAARGDGYRVSLKPTEVVLDLRGRDQEAEEPISRTGAGRLSNRRAPDRIRIKVSGANPAPRIAGVERLPGVSNYFVGRDPAAWRAGVPTFAEVEYAGVYPGVDLVYYGNQRQLEYDFRLAPGADPRGIELEFEGAAGMRLDANGDLVLDTESGGELRQLKPVSYQLIGGERREVESRYRLAGGGRAAFELGEYDRSLPLVIDPVLSYSTYLGGMGFDEAHAVARGSDGSIYVAGEVNSADFPGPSALQGALAGATDAFVLKLNPAGTAIVYATYVGGGQADEGTGIAVDGEGNAYVTGHTRSANFPRTAGALQPAKSGSGDAFAVKLNPSGTALAYSTFLGGPSVDYGTGVAVDAAGHAHVTGYSHSARFINGTPMQKGGSPVYKTADSAASWQPAENGFDESAATAFAVHPTDSNIVYAGTNNGVYKTADGGATWALTGEGNSANDLNVILALLVDPSNPSTVYAAGTSGVFKSTNGGASYVAIVNGLQTRVTNTLAADPTAPATLYAGTVRGVFKTTNGGATWAAVNAGLTSQSSIPPRVNKLAVDPINPSVVYAATPVGVFKTTNGGTNWTHSSSGLGGGFPLQVNSVQVDPIAPSVLYAGTTIGGVYKSTDAGASWAAINTGLQIRIESQTFTHTVVSLAINPSAPNVLYAGTSGFGIFKSTDAGATWVASGAGIANRVLSTNALEVDRANPATVYAGFASGSDAFAVRLNPTGTAADYSVFLGGDESDAARGVAADAAGNAYLVGSTNSRNFPVASPLQPASGGSSDAFVVKLSPSGATLYSTYLGGGGFDEGHAIAVDSSGRAHVTGRTYSADFPAAGPRQTALNSVGYDLFVARLAPAGAALDYSVLHGGRFDEEGFAIALDPAGNAYVTGYTESPDFPAVEAPQPAFGGFQDAFVLKLGPASEVLYSTYLGGSNAEAGLGIAADGGGAAYVVGYTSSSNFPVASPLKATYSGDTDAFLARLGSASDLSLTLTASRDTVMVGGQLVYTLTVANAGPSAAAGVKVSAALTGSLTASASATQGTCSVTGGGVACELGELAPRASATVTVTVTPSAPGQLSTSATVSANELDRNPANNAASHTAQASSQPSIAGRILNAGGAGLAGVSVSLSGSQSAAADTDARGYYQFTGLAAGGSYVVKPAKAGFTFTPLSHTLSDLRRDATADFAAAPCSYGISPGSLSVASSGGTSTIDVNANGDCPWTAVSHSDWITITSGASGQGSGVVTISVAPASAPRVGRLTVAGRSFVVWQEFASCGTPAFLQAQTHDLSIVPTQAVAADFNNDGKPDLAALQTLQGQNRVAVLLGTGAGGFGAPAYFAAGGNNRHLDYGDLNGDGNLDLIATDLLAVQFLFGDGRGSFAAPVNRALNGRFHYSTEVADFNLDGKPDLAVTHQDPDNSQDIVSVLLGDGAGGFGQPRQTFSGAVGAAADFNNDGKIDLAVLPHYTRNFDTKVLFVRLGDGAGGFGPEISTPLPEGIVQLTVGDVNGDANADVVTRVAVLLGRGDGGFDTLPAPALPQHNALLLADLNNDAKPDLVASATTGFHVSAGDGAGGFGAAANFASPQFNFSPVAADFNGDGRLDLASANYDYGVSVLLNGCSAPAGISITGKVTNEYGVSIANARVLLTSQRLGTLTTFTNSSGSYAFRNLSREDDYTLRAEWPSFVFNSQTVSRPAADTVVNFTAVPNFPRFDSLALSASEGDGRVRVFVRRPSESLNRAEFITVATVDDPAAVPCDPTATRPDGTPYPRGAAYARCDYATTVETLHFPAGQQLSSFVVPLIDDGHAEGPETLQLRIYDPNLPGAASPPNATLTIVDNDGSAAPNPISSNSFFVRMQYLDFLSREPEPSEPWTAVLDRCPDVNNTSPTSPSAKCDRLHVSQSFFRSPEFSLKGFYTFLFYRAAFGRRPAYDEIVPDMRSLAGQTGQEVVARRAQYAASFAQRPEFKALYDALSNQQYVAALLGRYGLEQITTEDPQNPEGAAQVTLTRQQLVDALDGNTLSRAQVLRAVVQSSEVDAAEYLGAFVAMQYYGYLRRTPEEDGYQAWLRVIRQNPNNIRQMVNGFVNSREYRLRFGNQN